MHGCSRRLQLLAGELVCFGSDKKETLGLRDAVLKVAGLHSTFHLFVTVIVSQVDFFFPPSNLPVRAREAFRSRYLRALAAPYLCKWAKLPVVCRLSLIQTPKLMLNSLTVHSNLLLRRLSQD